MTYPLQAPEENPLDDSGIDDRSVAQEETTPPPKERAPRVERSTLSNRDMLAAIQNMAQSNAAQTPVPAKEPTADSPEPVSESATPTQADVPVNPFTGEPAANAQPSPPKPANPFDLGLEQAKPAEEKKPKNPFTGASAASTKPSNPFASKEEKVASTTPPASEANKAGGKIKWDKPWPTA